MNGWLERFKGRRLTHLLRNGLILVGLGATSGCTCGSTDVVPDAGPPPTVLPTPTYEHIPVTYGPPPPPRDCKVPVDIPPEELLWGHPSEGLNIFNYTPIPCKSDPECHKLKGTGWYCDEGFHMGDRDCPVKKTPSCVEGERPKKQTKKPVD